MTVEINPRNKTERLNTFAAAYREPNAGDPNWYVEIPGIEGCFRSGKTLEEAQENIKEALIANNNGEVYRLLGVERFAQYVGAYVANIILSWLSSAILFILVFVGLQLLVRWLDILARLPIIYGLNKIAGTFFCYNRLKRWYRLKNSIIDV